MFHFDLCFWGKKHLDFAAFSLWFLLFDTSDTLRWQKSVFIKIYLLFGGLYSRGPSCFCQLEMRII